MIQRSRSLRLILPLLLLAARPAAALELASGFESTVFLDKPGTARHLAVGPGGWVFAALARPRDDSGLVAARDTDGDGVADDVRLLGSGLSGSGLAVYDGALYYGEDTRVLRFELGADGLPAGDPRVIVDGFPEQRAHAVKALAFDTDGHLYVNVGVPSNACQVERRTKGSPGRQPCPELERHGSIWRFDARRSGQDQMRDGERFSTGHRNAMAIDWDPQTGGLLLAQHGRDDLHRLFPDMYSEVDSAELPAEEFHLVRRGDDLGWPYSYYDHRRGERIRMPEYGGGPDQVVEGKKPLVGFPGHWAPNDLVLLDAASPLGRGVLIAFHGSWNRSPVQQGYRVVFQPLTPDGRPAGEWIDFANGFAGAGPLKTSGDAEARPGGLAVGPEGAVYVSSAVRGGRIWRIAPRPSMQKASAARVGAGD